MCIAAVDVDWLDNRDRPEQRRHAWRLFRPYVLDAAPAQVAILVNTCLAALLPLLTPYATKLVLDLAIPRRDLGLVIVLSCVALGAILGKMASEVLVNYVRISLQQAMVYRLKRTFLRLVLAQPLAYFEDHCSTVGFDFSGSR